MVHRKDPVLDPLQCTPGSRSSFPSPASSVHRKEESRQAYLMFLQIYGQASQYRSRRLFHMAIISGSRHFNVLHKQFTGEILEGIYYHENFAISLNFNNQWRVCGQATCIKTFREAAIGEELPCEGETRNTKDRYAVAVKNLPCKNYHKNLYTANLTTVMVQTVHTISVNRISLQYTVQNKLYFCCAFSSQCNRCSFGI